MGEPEGFSWVDRPHVAAMGRPTDLETCRWLRAQGLEVLVSLTEERPRRDWTDEAGLLVYHEPIEDMEAPTQEQLDRIVSAVVKASEGGRGVVVHCGAGLGRTGSVLAAYLVAKGMSSGDAIAQIRQLRPGSIETKEQEEAIHFFARRRRREAS